MEVETLMIVMKANILLSYTVSSILLLTGGLIYLLYRPFTLRMFKWFNLNDSTEWLVKLRSLVPTSVPDWFVYALPDGLWSCAYVIAVGAIWRFAIPQCVWATLLIPLIGIISELLQKMKILPGVYDRADLIAYSLGTLSGLMFIYIIYKRESNKHIIS